jgi:hypothetical protein
MVSVLVVGSLRPIEAKSSGRLGREWPHARQIDRVARQGGEGVQDAVHVRGRMSHRLGKSYTTCQVAP